MKHNRLRGLYAITDSQQIPVDTFDTAMQQALKGGAQIIQYRDKSDDTEKRLIQARKLRKLCDQFDALLIINDDIHLTEKSKADGVHLGKDDASISEARTFLGDGYIIGQSCYNDINQAIEAENSGADYIAFGAVYRSPTKPDAPVVTIETIRQARTLLSLPICAIGGIDISNAAKVIETGVNMIAVINGIFSGPDIEHASKELAALF